MTTMFRYHDVGVTHCRATFAFIHL
jgi:hypothetical protein